MVALVVVLSLVVVAALGGGGWFLWQRTTGGATAQAGDPSTLEVLGKGTLNETDVRGVDATALFYASFKKLVTQPVLHTTQESYTEKDEYDNNEPGYRWESGFDYKTKEWQMLWGSADADSPLMLCLKGGSHDYSPSLKRWYDPRPTDSFCQQKRAWNYVSDGLAAGGLTEAQADTWVKDLQSEQKGFVNPGEARLAEVKGKQYLRLVVDYKPVKQSDGIYYGGQMLMWSFKKTGLDPESHPYSYNGGLGTGYHVVYYIDPRSMLPAYTEVEQTPPLDRNGKPREPDFYKVRVEYHWPGKMPGLKPSGKPTWPKLTWPRDGA
ncbi:hypothetical protein ABZ897_11890 [Nonomuraea sp. NPDC046802]|uniref:hypothetical protein n=1 Tax=Nonomuraea sp. NPDC046802 TaxID=3154919 RepID=UPI0033FDB5E1